MFCLTIVKKGFIKPQIRPDGKMGKGRAGGFFVRNWLAFASQQKRIGFYSVLAVACAIKRG